jgi:dipeptidyl aminopeptidase/acylaminoacyl peptidase
MTSRVGQYLKGVNNMVEILRLFRGLRFHRMIALVTCAAASAGVIAPQQPGAPRAAGRPLAIEDYYRIPTVGSPEISPDGRWVSFTVGVRLEGTNGNKSEVWLVAADGATSSRRVSADGADASAPQWTEENRLRFTSEGKTYLLDPGAPDKIAEATPGTAGGVRGGGRGVGGRGGGNGISIASPDGKRVAMVRNLPPAKRERVFESEFAKRHEERFKGTAIDWLDYKRDGSPWPVPNRVDPEVAPPQEIFIGEGGGAERQLTKLGFRPAGVQWSQDGGTLLFTADSGYRNERSYGRSDIWTASLDGRSGPLTSNQDFSYTNARYSPDGRWILATRDFALDMVIAKKLNHGGPVDLIVMPAGGGEEKNLTADWDYLPASPQWSPDGKYVYFTGGIGGTTHLFRVAPTGGTVTQVTSGERRIGGLSFDRAMTKMAFTVGRFEAPAEIFTANIDGTGERQLTHIFDPLAAEVALGRSDRLQFKSADGTPLEGWLLFPYGYRSNGGPYPLIVSNHGGPHSAVGYGFDFKSQYFAASGYFVLQVNFRSSTGYGEKFLWATWGGWGTKDGQDVMAGVDHVIKNYPVNAGRVATIGHSYGGFMSNWLITQYPDRFAAAIPGAGISNWISDYGLADIARTKETEFYGAPWDPKAREIMIRQSPLTYAHRVKAATLFIHGEDDHRVPFEEGEQMYFALKKNGVPAKIIQYAGQSHGIAGHWNQVHRMLNERAWLDTYLKGVKPSHY